MGKACQKEKANATEVPRGLELGRHEVRGAVPVAALAKIQPHGGYRWLYAYVMYQLHNLHNYISIFSLLLDILGHARAAMC